MDIHASNAWVDGLTIDQVLRKTAGEFANQRAIVFDQPNWQRSWSEFEREVDRAAKGLMAIGIKPCDHVAVWATNVPQWVILQFATARIGAVLVALNPACRVHELAFALKQSDALALFLIDRFKTTNYIDLFRQTCPGIDQDDSGQSCYAGFPKLRQIVLLRGDVPKWAISWDQMLEQSASVAAEQVSQIATNVSAGDPVNIQYTSGTTGQPKAAMLSHRNLLMNAFYVGQRQNLTHRDRICIPVPFYHCFGCVLGTLCSAVYGAGMIVPAEFFNARQTLQAIERHRATAIYGVPTMFIAELQDSEFERFDTRCLRTGIMAGAPCPVEVMKQVMYKLGASELTIAYGLTEASPVLTQTRTDDPVEMRVETVGQALPGVKIKIIDPETGATLNDQQPGELCSQGHGTMIGYYNNPQATREAIDSDGWLHSGDLAIRQPDGYFRITGRIKDMVIRGGENIYPREIEEFLFSHPDVAQVSVVGVPDAKFGEEVCAWVKLKSGRQLDAESLQDYCRENLSRQKVPYYIKFVDEFPQTATGKIQKFKIRKAMIEELGLDV